jgi:uncharacterized protein YjbI with pentapeptide repeats
MKTLAAALCALALVALCPATANAGAPHVCTGCSFAGATLNGLDFRNVVYMGANFAGAKLERADFRGAKLVGSNFREADLRDADFTNANCTGCNLQDADLTGARFGGARMTGSNFSGFSSGVDDAQLRALLGSCIGCNFRNAQLAGRDLSGIMLLGVTFAGANLRNTKFDNDALCWRNTRNGAESDTGCIDLRAAQVSGASFRGVKRCDHARYDDTCVPVDAQTLRQYTGSSLDGAILP